MQKVTMIYWVTVKKKNLIKRGKKMLNLYNSKNKLL